LEKEIRKLKMTWIKMEKNARVVWWDIVDDLCSSRNYRHGKEEDR